MDITNLYNDIYKSMLTKFEDACIEFAMYIIKENDTPDECLHCPFRPFKRSDGYFCDVINRQFDGKSPHCNIYDFIKYILGEL